MTVDINYTNNPASAPAGAKGPVALGTGVQHLHQFQFNIADVGFVVAPSAPEVGSNPPKAPKTKVPSKLLRQGSIKAAINGGLLEVDFAGAEPHKDYTLCQDSTELVYITKEIIGSGLVKKIMAAGAKAGSVGRMELYKGATTLGADQSGEYESLLVREFVVNDNDIQNRETGQPASGVAPTVNNAWNIVDNGGDGYHHV